MKLADRPGYEWVMVAVAFLLAVFSFGVLGSVGVFLKPLAAEFGWSRGGLSLGYTVLTLSTALSAVFWGIVSDRYGTQWIAVLGAVAMGIALLLLGDMETLAEYYAYHFLFGVLGHAVMTGPMLASVSLWFTRNVGLAIGLTVSGGAVGQGLVPFIARFLIDAHGWRAAYLYLGIGYLLIALPISLLVRDSARRLERRAAAPPKMRDGNDFPLPPAAVVAWISAAVLFCCVAMSVPVVHVVPLLTDKGMDPENAVTVLLILMIAGTAGRILGGKLADMIGALQAYAAMSLGQTVLIFLFPHVDNVVAVYALAIAFGVFFSADMAAFLVCVRTMVPAHVMARSMAVVSMFGWIGMGLGGWQGGAMFDLTGDYNMSFANGSVAGVINLLILGMFALHIRRGIRARNVGLAAAE
jgi:predicted MFS family arabinose efflux permease